MDVALALALVAALAAVGLRALSRRRRARGEERTLAATPGATPENPLRIRSFHELDDAVDELRCPCGGPLERIGEGGRPGLRVVRTACTICERDVDLFFDLSELRH